MAIAIKRLSHALGAAVTGVDLREHGPFFTAAGHELAAQGANAPGWTPKWFRVAPESGIQFD